MTWLLSFEFSCCQDLLPVHSANIFWSRAEIVSRHGERSPGPGRQKTFLGKNQELLGWKICLNNFTWHGSQVKMKAKSFQENQIRMVLNGEWPGFSDIKTLSPSIALVWTPRAAWSKGITPVNYLRLESKLYCLPCTLWPSHSPLTVSASCSSLTPDGIKFSSYLLFFEGRTNEGMRKENNDWDTRVWQGVCSCIKMLLILERVSVASDEGHQDQSWCNALPPAGLSSATYM